MDPSRDFPDLGPRFPQQIDPLDDRYQGENDWDLSWSAVSKRTYEAHIRGERPNLYGEYIDWELA